MKKQKYQFSSAQSGYMAAHGNLDTARVAYYPESVPAGVRPLEIVGELTPVMLDALRAEFGKLERVDPCSKSYENLTAYVDRWPEHHLRQIAEADIKFASVLCANRLRTRGWHCYTVSATGQKPVQYFSEDVPALASRLACRVITAGDSWAVIGRDGAEFTVTWFFEK